MSFGRINGTEIIRSIKERFADPKWKWSLNQINDYSGIKELIMTREDIDKIAELEKQKENYEGENREKWALIVTNELYDVVFKYYATRSKRRKNKTEFFKNIDDALQWIGLDTLPNGMNRQIFS
jgi:hypothetical protein